MKIKFVDSSRFRNDEHFQFHTEVKDLVNLSNPEILKIQDLFPEYPAQCTHPVSYCKKTTRNNNISCFIDRYFFFISWNSMDKRLASE